MKGEKLRRKKSGLFVSCEYCGKQIYKTQTNYNRHKHHYCSNECQHKKQAESQREDRICEICGNIFNVGKKSTQRFCSVACQNEWQSQQTGDKNKRYHRLMVACDNCGKNVSIIPANQNRFKKHFCSNSCRREWYASVWSQSKEWREESAKRAVKILSNMEKARTRPQIIVNEMLDDAGIQYINEYGIGRYAIDNFLPNQNLMIEVMGDFWHCNPTVYDSPIYRIQKERIIKDTEKHSYILDVCHLQTLYLWEKDVIDRPQLCRRLIAEYVDSNGNLQYYHSYNWEIQNGVLLPNANPIPEYQNRNTEEKIAS